MYKQIQKKYYEKEWNKIKLKEKPAASGWRTNVPAPHFLKFIKWLKKNKISGNVLDIGCGGGRYSVILAKEGFEVYGIDFISSAIKLAKENAQKAGVVNKTHFRVGDALSLPYKSHFFDVVNDDDCLHHIAKEDWKLYIFNIKKVLKKGGILKIKAFSNNCNYYKKNRPKNINEHWLKTSGDYTYFFSEKEIKNLFKKEFEIIILEEKFHPVTKEKKFFFIILKKK